MLTIFTSPKPFRGHIKVIQTNAIQSWALLRPECEIILFGNEEGTAEIAAKFKMCHIPQVECNEYGTPLINSMFKIAQDSASYPLVCYANADIILMSDFMPAVQRVPWQAFLLVGQRWDFDIEDLLDFSNPDWEKQLRAQLLKAGRLHPPTGIDYFVFPRGLYRDIPPFAVGRPGWDNWIVYRTRTLRIPVIDATKAITIVHQNHGHSAYPGGEKGFWEGPEARRNLELIGGYNHCFNVHDATRVLTMKGMKRASPARILYQRGLRLAGSLSRLLKQSRSLW